MKRLVVEGWLLLVYFEFLMSFRKFRDLHAVLAKKQVQRCSSLDQVSKESICSAMDYACTLYFKQVLCLQRSSATTVLLRRYGWNAELVVGVQTLPFKSHAWVEVGGTVVNDRAEIIGSYKVLKQASS